MHFTRAVSAWVRHPWVRHARVRDAVVRHPGVSRAEVSRAEVSDQSEILIRSRRKPRPLFSILATSIRPMCLVLAT